AVPPVWFMEGMAEYLSVGPIDNHTAMWLRDAAVEGHLPTLQQLSYEEVFPYYFGHAIWAYIGEKWGDEAVGQILQASTSAGVEGAFKRVIGVNLDELISGWRDAVQTTYLPQLADHYRARRLAQPPLTRQRSEDTLPIAPARIPLPLNGLTTPSWAPDAKQLAFTGYDGGLSDLFIVNADGSDLRRLTNDKYADLQPSWAPDGKTIAFATDRGAKTDFDDLKFGNMRIALFHLDKGTIELLGHMDQGKNIDPVWAPDGKSLAFVSDRSGISNVFLYDVGNAN